MKKTDWQKIIKASADPIRVRDFLNSSIEAGAQAQLEKFSADSARALAALVSGSQFLGGLLPANPGWLSVFDFGQLQFPRRAEGLRRAGRSQKQDGGKNRATHQNVVPRLMKNWNAGTFEVITVENVPPTGLTKLPGFN